jgi:hypothetical protein
MSSKFQNFVNRKTVEYGDKFDSSELSKQFIPYYETGQRIEVEFPYSEEIKRGTVGVTTGWKPCFLLMLRSNSLGSIYTLDDNCKILKVIR